MRRLVSLATALLIGFTGVFLAAQAPPAPQTARQALIEMFFGAAPNHLEKHLPDVTRHSLQKLDTGDGRSLLNEFSMLASQAISGGASLQTFDSGPTLVKIAQQPGIDEVELTIERDDLVGDEDQIEVGLHMTKAAREQMLPFVPRFTFSMKTESDVWRLNEISVTVRLPLTDPDFLKSIGDQQRSQNEQMSRLWLGMVTAAEKSYYAAHGSYACSLSALGAAKPSPENRGALLDNELAAGKKGGYVYVITGCDSSHYKVVAEPAAPESGQRAFCSDETGAVRASADGKAGTCLRSGESADQSSRGDYATGVASLSASPATQAEPPAQKTLRVRVSPGVSQGLLQTKVQPVYPPEAKAARVQGAVVLKATISKTGDIENLELVSGDPMLIDAAENAVKQWKYKPYFLNGNPIEVQTNITMNFALSGK